MCHPIAKGNENPRGDDENMKCAKDDRSEDQKGMRNRRGERGEELRTKGQSSQFQMGSDGKCGGHLINQRSSENMKGRV